MDVPVNLFTEVAFILLNYSALCLMAWVLK